MKKLITLAAMIAACGVQRNVVRNEPDTLQIVRAIPAPPQRREEFDYSGYKIFDGNFTYEYNSLNSQCILDLGNGTNLKDIYCDGTVEQINDEEGFLSCFYYPNAIRCYGANDIYTEKRESMRVYETHQRWLESGSNDIITYLTN